MRILGTKPSSVILSQTKKFQKLKSGVLKVPKQSEAKIDGVINPQIQSIFTRKMLMLSKRYESTEIDRITWLHVPSGTHWSTSSYIHQVVEMYKKNGLNIKTDANTS